MEESLREFIDELLPDAGINPDTFIIVAAEGDDLTFCTSSNSHKRTLDTLKRAVALHEEEDNG